jgi:hypothetical protein
VLAKERKEGKGVSFLGLPHGPRPGAKVPLKVAYHWLLLTQNNRAREEDPSADLALGQALSSYQL